MPSKKVAQIAPFSARLKSLINTRLLTQQKLADKIGASRSAVAKWCRGAIPNGEQLYALSRILGVSMDYLYAGIPFESRVFEGKEEVPISKLPSNAIPEGMRRHIADMFNIANNPQLAKMLSDIFWDIANRTAADHQKKPLTKEVETLTSCGVNPVLSKLIERVKHATAQRGKKVELAKWLGVHRQSVTDWLSGKQEPGGEITLQMLQWVEQQERKT